MRLYLLNACLAAAVLAGPAMAQSQADFVGAFSGDWVDFDQQMANGPTRCQVSLEGLSASGQMPASAKGCAAPLDAVANWSISGTQLVLADSSGSVIVKLGGNQKRVNGADASGKEIILERPGGDGNAAGLKGAYNASGCYYLGYSQDCVPVGALGQPEPGADGTMRIKVEVNLNVHAEPRGDADVVGVVRKGTCVVVDQCTTASDGPWCRAQFGDKAGWMRKLTLRQNRWPISTFSNSCAN